MLVAALLLSAGPAGAARVPDEVMVRFRPGAASDGHARRAAEEIGARLAGAIPRLRVRLLKLPPGLSVGRAIERLSLNPNVEVAEPNRRFRPAGVPDDPYFTNGFQWALDRIGATLAWSLTLAGARGDPSVLIAIVDSGVLAAHADLTGKVAAGYDTLTEAPSGEPDGSPGSDHGTFVASIAAARTNDATGIAGVAWEPRVLAVAANDGGTTVWTTSEFYILKGLGWAVDNGARVVNMSLGNCWDDGLGTVTCEGGSQIGTAAMVDAWTRGVVLVAAAGNESTTMLSYPAAYPFVLGVSATDRLDGLAFYSNRGGNVDVAAPGGTMYVACGNLTGVLGATSDPSENCLSVGPFCGPGGVDCRTVAEGTSISAPHVAGLAAVLFGQDPSRTPAQVVGLIRSTADQPGGATGWNDDYGYGRINMAKALMGAAPAPAAALVATVAVSPASASPGDTVTVRLTVSNAGTGPAMEIVPGLTIAPAILTPVGQGAAWSATVVLAAGANWTFEWTFTAATPGTAAVTANVEGADVVTGGALVAAATGQVTVAGRAAFTELTVYPNPAAADEVRLGVPLSSPVQDADVEIRSAATLALVYRGVAAGVTPADPVLRVTGLRAWAPGVYLVRVTVRNAAAGRATHGPVRLVVKR